MSLSHEHVGCKITAKINTVTLIRAELLINLCYEIPCIYFLRKYMALQNTAIIYFWNIILKKYSNIILFLFFRFWLFRFKTHTQSLSTHHGGFWETETSTIGFNFKVSSVGFELNLLSTDFSWLFRN